MSAIQKLIQHVKEGWEFSDYQDQIEFAETAQVEFDQLTNLKNDAHARLVELGMTMPCGHLARYAVSGEEGTQYCALCAANELETELSQYKKFFNEVEWSGDQNKFICPDCANNKERGHRYGCRYRIFRGEQ